MWSIAVEVEFVEKETEAVIGEEGVLSQKFYKTKGGASQESYTKKATDDDTGYEFCHTKGGAFAAVLYKEGY